MPAFLAPLLSSLGSAALGGFGALGSAVGGAVLSGIGAAGSFALNGILGVVGGAGRLALGIVGHVVQGVVSAIAALPSLVLGVVQGIVGAVGSVAGSILKVGSLFAGVFVGGLTAAAAGLKLISAAAVDFSRSVRTLSAQTGLGIGRSAGVVRGFGAIGIGPEAVGGAFGNQNPWLFRMKAGIYGLPGYDDPRFSERFASRYQSLNARGPIGNILARSMTRTLGVDSPAFLEAASYSPRAIRANQSYASNINAKLGLTPEQIGRYSEAIPLALARLSTGFQAIVQKVAGVALPVLENSLSRVASYIGNNAGKIGEGIQRVADWLLGDGAAMVGRGFIGIINLMKAGVDWFVGFTGEWSERLPAVWGGFTKIAVLYLSKFQEWLGHSGASIIHGISTFFENVGLLFGGWMNNLASFLENISQSDPWNQAIMLIAGALDLGVQVFKGFAATLSALWAVIQTGIAINPVAQVVWAATGNGLISAGNPVTAYNDTMNAIPDSDLYGSAQNFVNAGSFSNAAKSLRQSAADQQAYFNGISASVKSNGYDVLDKLTGGVGSIIDWLQPKGQPNRGVQLGTTVGGWLGSANGFAKDNIQPVTDSLANLANGSAGGNAGGFQETNGLLRQVVAELKKGNDQGAQLPRTLGSFVGGIVFADAEAQGRAILSQGG